MLKIKRHIVRTNWMLASETVDLFNALQGGIAQNEPQALFVGGCVRDTVLDRDVSDFDIATPLTPEAVCEILGAKGIRVIPTGIDHGTVTAILGEYSYEITTLRRDMQTDGRHAIVAYTDSWQEDARRRDFTINTLLMDLMGNIYDPLDCGLMDLDKGVVRFVGKASQRIDEDYLRILRFFRFSALYGGAKFDEEGLIACKKAANNISSLSRERITQEFFKIIASDKPYEVLNVMFAHDILKNFDFSDDKMKFFEYFCGFQSRYKLCAISSRLFVMASMDLDNVKAMQGLILFPKVFLTDMKAISGALNLPDLSCDAAVRESVYRFGRVSTAQALMIELTQDRVMNSYASKALDIVQNWDIPDFPVNGEDLIVRGIKPSPEMGAELKRLEDKWIAQDFTPDRDECLSWL